MEMTSGWSEKGAEKGADWSEKGGEKGADWSEKGVEKGADWSELVPAAATGDVTSAKISCFLRV